MSKKEGKIDKIISFYKNTRINPMAIKANPTTISIWKK